jgi:transposase
MAQVKKPDQKALELRRTGTLHPHPDSVTDALFKENPFFDPRDLLQVRYEMLRRHKVEGVSIVDVAVTFGVSRPTVYQAQTAFQQAGLGGLLPKRRGPKQGHKLSVGVIEYVRDLRTADPHITTVACVQAVQQKFGITVHRRSLERALGSKKKLRRPL